MQEIAVRFANNWICLNPSKDFYAWHLWQFHRWFLEELHKLFVGDLNQFLLHDTNCFHYQRLYLLVKCAVISSAPLFIWFLNSSDSFLNPCWKYHITRTRYNQQLGINAQLCLPIISIVIGNLMTFFYLSF